MKTLLLIPPMTQINMPFPSTAYLSGYLRAQGHQIEQDDLGLKLALKLFSKRGLAQVRDVLLKKKNLKSDAVLFFLEAFEDYQACIEPVVRFLQGKDPSLALRITARTLLPEGPRFLPLREHKELTSVFGELGTQDMAKYLASLFLDDISDVVRDGVDEQFGFSRYAESLASSEPDFSKLYKKLHSENSLIDQWLFELCEELGSKHKPDVIGLSIPFPGNVYAALKIAQYFKIKGNIKIVVGGGFVNTELRELADPRFFEFIDYLVFDDGEKAFEQLLFYFQNKAREADLIRTWFLKDKKIFQQNSSKKFPFKDHPGPDYRGLPMSEYISMMELPNPMHRMWSDFRWNKLILAHGCYWHKCSFCDVHLDYIERFEPQKAEKLIEQIEKVIEQTGSTGFHFVDEAAPPALLKALSQKLIEKKIKITWWGNLRFDSYFTPEVAQLMADAGCVAVTGGLEVASPRVLKLIDKGIDIEQVAKVTKAFKEAGIYVHAYLMYGFPTQTTQETIDSLEVVRQLFAQDCLHSGYWHRFMATAHSPVGKNPKNYGIELRAVKVPKEGLFSKYEIPFEDPTGTDHDQLGVGLKKALYNYMHGIGLKEPLQNWFDMKIPKPTVDKVRRS
jgi:hypothetical protein